MLLLFLILIQITFYITGGVGSEYIIKGEDEEEDEDKATKSLHGEPKRCPTCQQVVVQTEAQRRSPLCQLESIINQEPITGIRYTS